MDREAETCIFHVSLPWNLNKPTGGAVVTAKRLSIEVYLFIIIFIHLHILSFYTCTCVFLDYGRKPKHLEQTHTTLEAVY